VGGVKGDSPIFTDHGFAVVPAKIETVPLCVTCTSLSESSILPFSAQTPLIPLVLTIQFGYLYATLSTAGELPRAVRRSKAIEKTFNNSGKGHGWPTCTPLRAKIADLG
jgi:hypothetical protein